MRRDETKVNNNMTAINKEAKVAIRQLKKERETFMKQSWSIDELKRKTKGLGLADEDISKMKSVEAFDMQRYLISDVEKYIYFKLNK